ncbi:MAG TPA: hypothetical protein VHP54_01740 [Caproiciproducens sp.]|nr:hypothetical protein [Caproiciproducens sp.]
MLGKLIKYEIRATSRIFLPMYALLFIFALINKFFISVNSDFFKVPQFIAMTGFVVIIVGICVMTLVVTIQRFNKNLLTDEGYLSFTLPVKAHSHVDCKMIVSLIWFVLSGVVAMLSIFVLAIDQNALIHFQEFFAECADAFRQVGANGVIVILEGILLLLLSVLSSTITIYAAITIGNMSSKHKLLAGVGAYLGFGIIEQIITTTILSALHDLPEHYFDNIKTIQSGVQAAEIVMLAMIIYTLIFGVVYYVLTNWMLKNKLNLE